MIQSLLQQLKRNIFKGQVLLFAIHYFQEVSHFFCL